VGSGAPISKQGGLSSGESAQSPLDRDRGQTFKKTSRLGSFLKKRPSMIQHPPQDAMKRRRNAMPKVLEVPAASPKE
jgi:hypothetical protein